MPLLIATPQSANAGRRTPSLVELLDLFPTLVELCGLPAPEGLQGSSLVPVLRDPQKSVKRAAWTQHPRPSYFDREPSGEPQAMGVSVRTTAVRYTEWREWKTGKTLARELYDAQHDPAELRNAVDVPAMADAQHDAEELLRQQFPVAR